MHILIIAPEQIPVPPVKGGSVEICITNIAERLAAKNQVTIVSRQHPEYPVIQETGNLKIVRVPAGKSPQQYIQSAVNAVCRQSFDVIQIDNRPKFVPVVRKAFPSTPISLFLHSLTFVKPERLSPATARMCMKAANLIVTNSRSTCRKLQKMFPSIRKKLATVTLGVDAEMFRPATSEEKEQLRQKYKLPYGFTVLFAGRMIPRKGIPVLLKAADLARHKVPKLQVVLAGNGRKGYLQRLRRQVRKLRVPVIFSGYIPHQCLPEWYRLADCFACPSQKHESFGLVNVEAMASGLPVVASRNGGIKEIIRHFNNGWLVDDYKDPRAFAKGLIEIARNKKLAERLSAQARKDAESRFHWDKTVRQLSNVYKSYFKLEG